MKLGIFGGTFNPPHIGHMVMADTAADALGLDQVFFVPAAEPPHKVEVPRADVEHRIKMVELAINGDDRFKLSRIDVDRPGPHYAVEMVSIVADQYPEADLYFLMGSDSLRDLLAWREPDGIIEKCYIVVMSRPVVPPDMDILHSELPLLRERLISVSSPEIDISSTNLVARIRNRQSVRYRIQDAVLEYIYEHKLYHHKK